MFCNWAQLQIQQNTNAVQFYGQCRQFVRNLQVRQLFSLFNIIYAYEFRAQSSTRFSNVRNEAIERWQTRSNVSGFSYIVQIRRRHTTGF